jgi:hypothetical protein
MLSRPHPIHGWLWLRPGDWRRTLERSLAERDALADPHHSGPAPAFCEWVADEQMPSLARQEHYRLQMQDRLHERSGCLHQLCDAIGRGRLDLQPDAVEVDREVKALEAWLA